jgi:hypothetical protein
MRALSAIILTLGLLFGQDKPSIVGSGYVLPSPLTVAPGQLVTIVMQGVEIGDTAVIRAAAGRDLPTSLADISVKYWPSVPEPRAVPILEIHYFCINGGPWDWRTICNSLAAVTVQIPFEAQPVLPTPLPGERGVLDGLIYAGGFQLSVAPVSDQVHVLTSCDAFLSPLTTAPVSSTGLPCPSVVTHADGSPVSAANPATAGEHLVIYAVGMGQTNPPSSTGKLVTEPARTQTKFTLDFNYRPNALASRPLPSGPEPLYAGTTPGFVGLYQINFVVPPVPAGTPPCVDATSLPRGSNVVESNLTVSVGGTYSFDGARICVAVPAE